MPSATAAIIRDRHYYTRELLLGVRLGTVGGFKTLKKLRESNVSKQVSLFAKLTSKVALLLTAIALVGLVVSAIFFLPQIYYRVFPAQVVVSESTTPGTVLGGDFTKPTKITEGRQYVPPIDESLPDGDWVIIPQIGVRTQFKETEDPNDALVDGAWLSPTYGKPGDTGVPIIIAAHRFGWQWWWQSDYGKYHSFYYLPDTRPGTQVEVISGKRKWVYEIYAGEENDEISDYSADLILYTCKHISSPVRFIRYARLVNPTLDTQPS
ncbi:hypothetical protein KC921_02585 [Candidatus Woesebacteria bacterium]|nr:hypothetical protein [Candidatus Woesebacteria bacterium]